ncbi:putative histone acetyltransferase complex component Epl1 [Bisporella sp. PMI_857]|nr:putative histone acetyltransferase complex component Epl1 [Bisporella sp. PMI_857]
MRSQQPTRIARVKKLSRSQGQQILREEEIDSEEYDSLHNQPSKLVSGVEAAEESEIHLQAALAAASSGEREGEIPAPPADESPDINYDSLYPLIFSKPASYIRFSQTVEDSTGCQYNMTTEDDLFLKEYNKKKSASSRCSEDAFEKIMAAFEEIATNNAPFASVDKTVVSFETMKSALGHQIEDKLHSFAKDFYDHWKARQQSQPSLKYETQQDIDDGDPYVCFRYREVRQTRKTRARDVQSTDRLKKLRRELEDGRGLVVMTHQREVLKRDALSVERTIFMQRAILKETKIKLNIKTNDEDLINQKPVKRPRTSNFQIPQHQIRLPGRSDGRPLDADLVQLSDLAEEKENLLRREIEAKTSQHRTWNETFVDLTRGPLSPVQGQETGTFRQAAAQYNDHYLITPPSSETSESFDRNQPIQQKPELIVTKYSSLSDEDTHRQPGYRKRIGRLNRLWIDRRNMTSSRGDDALVSDRWKYDQDSDDEMDIYERDPYDTNAIRFRASM